jgi:hypothetical protein
MDRCSCKSHVPLAPHVTIDSRPVPVELQKLQNKKESPSFAANDSTPWHVLHEELKQAVLHAASLQKMQPRNYQVLKIWNGRMHYIFNIKRSVWEQRNAVLCFWQRTFRCAPYSNVQRAQKPCASVKSLLLQTSIMDSIQNQASYWQHGK